MSDQKHPGGRPPKFSSVAALEEKIEDYFKTIEEQGKHPTITGMALHLGFVDRQSFYDYKGKDQFSGTMKKARLRIEAVYEANLHGNSPTGSIFALKNFGWRDRHELTGPQGAPLQIEVVSASTLPPDESSSQ